MGYLAASLPNSHCPSYFELSLRATGFGARNLLFPTTARKAAVPLPRHDNSQTRAPRASGGKSLDQPLLDLRLDCRRRRGRREALDDLSFLVNQKLGKVPLDTVAQQAALFAFEKLEYRD